MKISDCIEAFCSFESSGRNMIISGLIIGDKGKGNNLKLCYVFDVTEEVVAEAVNEKMQSYNFASSCNIR